MYEDTLAIAILCLAKGKNRMVAEFYDSVNHKFLFPQEEKIW